MPRDLVFGNGSMLVNFDGKLNIRDLYFPKVGLDNHIMGHYIKIGIWAEEKLSWLDCDAWERKIGYIRNTLVSDNRAVNSDFGISLEMSDAVHYRRNIYLKKIKITNLRDAEREIRIFFSHDISINGSNVGDTAFYDPTRNCICHYKRNRYFLINGNTNNEGIYQYAVGTKRFKGAEGTWRDAEDGLLEMNPIAHGSVDSTVSFRVIVPAAGSSILYYWIAVGEDMKEVREGNEFILDKGPERVLDDIKVFWNAWVMKKDRDFKDLPQDVVDMYYRSLLVVRTQFDNGGGILAATDSDVLSLYPDHYDYVWPRDGALVAYALDYAGFPELTRRFFEFCTKIITEGGFFLHKYNSDATLGSSWHPWWKNDRIQLPIQEDETALVLFALGKHYQLYRDLDFIESMYQPLITKAADFLESYRDPGTKLPLPSFDLWEERYGIFSFTSAAVYGALTAASYFACMLNDKRRCNKYREAGHEIKEAMGKYLYNSKLGRFIRGLYLHEDGTYEEDFSLDSSMYGLFEFGAFSPVDDEVVRTMNAVRENLWVKTDVGGVARYTDDYYFKVSNDIQNVPGNPWVICTLWVSEWLAEWAGTLKELEKCRDLIQWAVKYSLASGVLSEQVHPYTGANLSVAPLTWSHSTFVLAVEKYLEKYMQVINQKR